MGIYNHGVRYIKAIGTRGSKVAVVSSVPKAKEQSLGRGYVSSHSQMLLNMLQRTGVLSHDVYATYVIKERPPKDDLNYYINFPLHSSKEPSYTEKYKMYEESLKKELEEWDGNVVVAVGKLPLYALTRNTTINNWRGSVLESTLVPGLKVIPTIDPATAFKKYIYTYLIMDDMIKVKVNSEYKEIKKRKRELLINPTFIEAMSFLEEAAKVPRIGSDIEGLTWMSCFSIAISETKAMSIPFVDSHGDYFTPDKEIEILKKYAEILENPEQEHVFHNGIYDYDHLFRYHGIRCANMQDSMVAFGITYPDHTKSLAMVTSLNTDLNYYKDEGKNGIKAGVNDSSFWVYNARDSIACLESYNRLEEDIKSMDNENVYSIQQGIIDSLVFMQNRGIRVDIDGMRQASENTDEILKPLYQKLNELAGYEINPRSPQQLKDYFYNKKGIIPYKKRVGNKMTVTTDEKALKGIAAKGYKEASIILEIRKLTKEQGTYLEMVFDEDNRFRTSFNQVTKNGRLSSSKTLRGTGGNSQNIPYNIKKYFLADENYMAYEIDLSQAENRIMAYACPEPEMISAFESNIDIHRKTAAMIFGISYEEVSDVKGSAHLGNGTKSQRFWGKTSNHSFNYDLGERSAANRFEISVTEARFLINVYHKLYPGVRKYHNWVKETLANDSRQLTNLMGRTRRFLGRWEDSLFKEAYNFIPQSTVADIINKHGLIGVYRNQEKFGGVELLNQVHDSIVFQISLELSPKEHADIISDIQQELQPLLKYRSYEFTIPAEIKMGYNLKEMLDVTPETWKSVKSELDK